MNTEITQDLINQIASQTCDAEILKINYLIRDALDSHEDLDCLWVSYNMKKSVARTIGDACQKEDLEELLKLTEPTIKGIIQKRITAAQKASEAAKTTELAIDTIWQQLRSSPIDTFPHGHTEALHAAGDLCRQAVESSFRMTSPGPKISEDLIYPLMALALASLHTAAEIAAKEPAKNGTPADFYTDWAHKTL